MAAHPRPPGVRDQTRTGPSIVACN